MDSSFASKLLWALLCAVSLMGVAGSTPEGTITDFVQAFNDGNLPKAATMVQGGKPDEDFSLVNGLIAQGMHLTLGVMKVAANGDNANVTVTVTLEMGNRKPTNETETVKLVRLGNDWLIVPGSETKGMITTMATMTTNPRGVFARAKEAAKKTACLSNIKQLGTAAIIYLVDNDDKFRMNPAKLKATLQPYTKNDRLWFCPAGPMTVPAYSINTNLIGKNAADIKDPANTVMLYEGSKGRLDFRHDGAAAVAFADGHAKIIKAADAKNLNWKP